MNDTGIEKKKKGKPAMARWRLFRWIAGLLVIGVLVIVILAIFEPIINGGQIRQVALDEQYIPTAEYLLKNPLPTPHSFPCALNVDQDAAGFMVDSDNVERFCVEGFLPFDVDVEFEFNSQQVNGHFMSYTSGLRDDSGHYLAYCIEGEVDPGLHLLSVEISSDSGSWAEKAYYYTWAIEITNDGYRYMPNYPFHNESD